MLAYTPNSLNTVQVPEFQAWTDVFGMCQINSNQGTSDNGNLFTAHYVFGLVAKGIMTPQEKARILLVYKNNFMQTGLLTRFPGDRRTEAQDDMFGLMGAEALMFPNPKDRVMTQQIYQYGKTANCHGLDPLADANLVTINKWMYWPLKIFGLGNLKYVWNTRSPQKFDSSEWLGRFGNLIATMQMAQGKLVNPIYWIWWAITMLLMYYRPNKSDLDSYALNMHSANACQGYGWLTNWVCNKVRAAVKRDYCDFAGVMNAYLSNVPNPYSALLSGVI